MYKQAVVNASPLIFLSKAGLIEMLQYAAPEVLVPEPVVSEIGRRADDDVTARTLVGTDWLSAVEVPVIPQLIQSWDLGPGESAVLAYAHRNPGVAVIIDDGAGRRCAETLGSPLFGTLGLVMIAKKRNRIPAARPVIAQLKQHGMYLSESNITDAHGQRTAVVLPIEEYEALLEDLADLATVAERHSEPTHSHQAVKDALARDGLLQD